MTKQIIGIDPDSTKHGVAVYLNGKLIELACMNLMQLMEYINRENDGSLEVHIENVMGNNTSSFNHSSKFSKGVNSKISEKVGRCKQAQFEVENMCEYLGVKVVKHKVSSQWKNGASKEAFKRITGWTGRSNEDSRSAAWFGYLGVTSK